MKILKVKKTDRQFDFASFFKKLDASLKDAYNDILYEFQKADLPDILDKNDYIDARSSIKSVLDRLDAIAYMSDIVKKKIQKKIRFVQK